MMIEIEGNIWEQKCDAICIPTNGFVKKNGNAVMGRGLAKQALILFPGIDGRLGLNLRCLGNHVSILMYVSDSKPFRLILNFPTKVNWYDKASMDLIERSTFELFLLTNIYKWRSVCLPRVGCGNGKLSWENEVRPFLSKILDDRFVVVHRDMEE